MNVLPTPSFGWSVGVYAVIACAPGCLGPARASAQPASPIASIAPAPPQASMPYPSLRPARGIASGFPGFEGSDLRPHVRAIFYPPNPPPLGSVLIVPGPNARPPSLAPAELADLVAAPFYAPLSTRLVDDRLSPEQSEMVADYRRLKQALEAELRVRIYELGDLDAGARGRLLRSFAAKQTPRVVALEALGERIRAELCHRGFLTGYAGHWDALRRWKLGRGRLDRPRKEIRLFEHQVMRAAVFYFEGLSAAQRRLLREIAMSMEEQVYSEDELPADDGWFFFSPEMARIRLPPGLSPPLRDRFTAFREEKQEIKAELQDGVYAADGERLHGEREADLRELAKRQESRIQKLELEAEAIREELARVGRPSRRPCPEPIPAPLADGLAAYEQDKQALQRGFHRRLGAVRDRLPPPPRSDPEAMQEWERQSREKIVAEARQFEAEHQEELEALRRRMLALRDQMMKLADNETIFSAEDGSDAYLLDFVRSRRMDECLYEYETAVYEPGLSPEQRRLLFGAALEKMRLPLPAGEDQPTKFPGTLVR